MDQRPSYRLPRNVVPRRYALEFTPDLTAKHFSGTASIQIEVIEPVAEFVLNAAGLRIEDVTLAGDDEALAAAAVTYRGEEEEVVLAWPVLIERGLWTLSMRFAGTLGEDLRGFYRTTVDLGDGTQSVIASTQCESTDARRVFPGWDEPDFKAVFAITLVVDPDLTALSNGPEISSEIDRSGKRRVTFAETMPMSTYLVALVVGHFVLTPPEMVGQVPVRIVARPELSHLTDVAQEASVAVLDFFQEYFGLPCPAEKMDHVAIPEFAAGAMENLGCITYREEALLVDRQRSSPMEQMRVVTVIAHETAHMWFGDLVTMRWWNGLWLNEAFATFMELLATDALHPEWDVWTTFGPGRAYALSVDGLASTRPVEFPVGRPSEASAMFDVLTYQKGGAILRAMEQYLGAETFRKGIGTYLRRHRYANTETADLWDALEDASGQPVRAVMDSWVVQPGYPLVHASWDSASNRLTLQQKPFRYWGEGEGTWQVPVVIEILSSQGSRETVRVLLGDDPAVMDLPTDVLWVKVNQGGWGFYRVAYDRGLWDRLVPSFAEMTALERIGLVDDAWAGVLADQIPLEQAVHLWRRFGEEYDPDVWSALYRQLSLLDQIASEEERVVLQALIGEIGKPVFAEVGWSRRDGEDVRRGRLRALLVRLMGTIGADSEMVAEAHRRLMAHFNGSETILPDLLSAVVDVVAHSGGMAEWDMIYRHFKSASTPQDETRYLYALADFIQPEAVSRTLALYRSNEVKMQHAMLAMSRALINRHAQEAAWSVVEQSWSDIVEKYPPSMLQYLVQPLGWMISTDVGPRAITWLDDHPIAEVARVFAQAKEFQAIHLGLARRLDHRMAGALGVRGNS